MGTPLTGTAAGRKRIERDVCHCVRSKMMHGYASSHARASLQRWRPWYPAAAVCMHGGSGMALLQEASSLAAVAAVWFLAAADQSRHLQVQRRVQAGGACSQVRCAPSDEEWHDAGPRVHGREAVLSMHVAPFLQYTACSACGS